jgi:predicted ribosome quality control (RQC) complex YloA/Tae2 family protein
LNLSAIVLKKLVEELAPRVTRRLIRGAFLTSTSTLYLDLGESGHLCLSARPDRSHLRFSEPSEKPLPDQPNWVAHQLNKSGIVAISHVADERIVQFSLGKNDRLGTESEYTLIFELIGRHANLILTDTHTNKILGALRHVRARQNRVREVWPGRPYVPPPAQGGVPAANLESHHLSDAFEKHPANPVQALKEAIAGLDEITATELCHRIACPNSPSPSDSARLLPQIREFLLAPPIVVGGMAVSDTQDRLHLSPLQITHQQPDFTFGSIEEGIAFLLDREDVNSSLKGQISTIVRDLNTRLTTRQLKLARMTDDLADAGKADTFERLGNLLMTHLPDIPNGAQTVTLTEIAGGEHLEIEIALDAHRSAIDNASDYIKKSQKARKGAPILRKRIAETQSEIDQIERVISRAEALQTGNQLALLVRELEEKRWLKPRTQHKQNTPVAKRSPDDIHPRRYRTVDNWLVLVGRNNQENDRLTKSASANDIFFHVHGCPGSHVILKSEGRSEKPPRSTLKEAASLAAYWSKARGARSAPVSYTDVRYVQKPKGAPAGLVTIRNEKSLMVAPREIRKEDEV